MVAIGGSENHKPLNEKERRRKPGRNVEGKAAPLNPEGSLIFSKQLPAVLWQQVIHPATTQTKNCTGWVE